MILSIDIDLSIGFFRYLILSIGQAGYHIIYNYKYIMLCCVV